MINSTVTEIYDMNTHIGKVGLIGIHTPRTDLLFKHLFGLFAQFKKWRYNGARITLIPSAQLPADIAGVAYEGGDQMVDPRDVFNPILHKGFTGESLGAFLDNYMDPDNHRGASLEYNIPGAVDDDRDGDAIKAGDETAYYQMLTQGNFKKMMPMGSIRNKWIYPMVYDVASTRQLLGAWNGSYVNRGEGTTVNSPFSEIETSQWIDGDQSRIQSSLRPGANETDTLTRHMYMGLDRFGRDAEYTSGTEAAISPVFLTPRKRKLGWMDTLQKIFPASASVNLSNVSFDFESEPYQFAQLPKLYEYLLVTPPSYYSKLYYRLIIHHSVSFAGLRSATGAGTAISSKDVEYNNFMEQLPTEANVATSASVDVLGGDVTPVTDGMQGSIV